MFFMYLLYLDDSGSPNNQAESYFVLGGICVFEAQVEWFGRETTRETSLQKLSREFRKAGTCGRLIRPYLPKFATCI